ncbi:HTH domain-containing protein [Halosimplex salinum]|uniref:HTH domain-containing protein n=1 Tax=Halosimplex salinum TaxID=1710538 RepID=UPI000F48EC23|nr:HTH domain-containing protein [Halosimplex salinum]
MRSASDSFATADRRHVDVFVRSMLPPLGVKATQETLISRLDELSEESTIDGVSVKVTGNRLCLCGTCTETDAEAALLDRFRELDEWGDEFDASTSPFFETRTLDSSITNETARALVPPRVTVALYCDGTLTGVFPCEMDDSSYTVGDFISALDTLSEGQQLVAER